MEEDFEFFNRSDPFDHECEILEEFIINNILRDQYNITNEGNGNLFCCDRVTREKFKKESNRDIKTYAQLVLEQYYKPDLRNFKKMYKDIYKQVMKFVDEDFVDEDFVDDEDMKDEECTALNEGQFNSSRRYVCRNGFWVPGMGGKRRKSNKRKSRKPKNKRKKSRKSRRK